MLLPLNYWSSGVGAEIDTTERVSNSIIYTTCFRKVMHQEFKHWPMRVHDSTTQLWVWLRVTVKTIAIASKQQRSTTHNGRCRVYQKNHEKCVDLILIFGVKVDYFRAWHSHVGRTRCHVTFQTLIACTCTALSSFYYWSKPEKVPHCGMKWLDPASSVLCITD